MSYSITKRQANKTQRFFVNNSESRHMNLFILIHFEVDCKSEITVGYSQRPHVYILIKMH